MCMLFDIQDYLNVHSRVHILFLHEYEPACGDYYSSVQAGPSKADLLQIMYKCIILEVHNTVC